MKLTMRYLRPHWAAVLLCVLLLLGQALSDLTLPNLMSGLVNVGIQQQGMDTAAPEAMSLNARTLLDYFAGEEAREAMQAGYYVIEPESTEAQRLAGEYPLARKEAVCVLRGGITQEERAALDEAYAQAAYGLLLYLQQAGPSGELESLAQQAAAQAALEADTPAGDYQDWLDSLDSFFAFDPERHTGPAPESSAGEDAAGQEAEGGDAESAATAATGSGAVSAERLPGPAAQNLETPSQTLPKALPLDSARDPWSLDPLMFSGSSSFIKSVSEDGEPGWEDMEWNDVDGENYGGEESSSLEPDVPGTGIEPADSPPDFSPFLEPEGGQEESAPEDGDDSQAYHQGGGERESRQKAFFGEPPLSPEPSAPPEEKFSAGGLTDLTGAGGLSGLSAQRLYQLLPLLPFAPQESLDEAMGMAGDGAMAGQVGAALKRLFYVELGVDTAAIQGRCIWRIGLQMLGVALLAAVAAVLVGLLSARVAAAVGRSLRHDIFAKVQSMGGPEFDGFSTASLITRTTNDVQQVQMLVTIGLRLVCYAPIMGIGGVMLALEKSVSMSWIVAVAVLVLVGLAVLAVVLVMPKFKALQSLMDRLNRISREHLSGMMVVRAFGNQAFEESRFEKANRELARTNRFLQRAMSAMMPVMMLGMNLASIAIVWVGGQEIARSTLQVGDMMAFMQYAMQIIGAFLMIAAIFVILPRASVSAGRIKQVLDTPLSILDPASPNPLEEVKGQVAFHDVSFRYGDAESPVLEHITFTAKPGETTAVIGATGAGKTTLVQLILRFYDVTEGSITLDGVDIRELSQEELRHAVGFVPQKAVLFSGTIGENLRWGNEDADDSALQEALDTAQAADFVGGQEGGLSAHIAQGGGNFSGGQRQRLAIARALARKAPVYIFDDSFSALDFQTDAALRKALRESTGQSAVIVVAQRISSIMHAEQILVLENGKIVGRGTHRQLLQNCPAYREIAESQLRKEELA